MADDGLVRRAGPAGRWFGIVVVVLAAAIFVTPGVGLGSPEPTGLPSEAAAVARGRCSISSHWRLSVRSVPTGLQVTLVLRTGRPGEPWRIFMDHNRQGFFAGRRTANEMGRVVARRIANDEPGVDTFAAGGNSRTGETCLGRIRF
jgi:hypothetical protein